MQVSANINTNYLFRPRYEELKPFVRMFGENVFQYGEGWTLAPYANVPNSIAKQGQYFGAIADKTKSFDTEQALLTYIKRAIDPCSGEIIDASEGLVLNPSMKVSYNQLGSQANHVPALFSRVKTLCNDFTVITAFEGIYDYRTRLFHGQIQLSDIRTLWNV